MGIEEEAICQAVAAFLARNDASLKPGADEELFSSGLLNSLFALELVTFLENRYSIRFSGADLDLANFATLHRIAGMVRAKQTAVDADRGGQ